MRSLLCVSLAALVWTALASPSSGGERIRRVWNSIKHDWVTANRWPDPYIAPDRELVREPLARQVQKGWLAENTLNDHHFETDTSKLSEAGRLKLQSILINTPDQYLTVVVQEGATEAATENRLAAVEEAARGLAAEDRPFPEIVKTRNPARGTPGEYLDAINVKFRSSTPIPRLAAPASASGSGGSGGSSN